MAEIAGLVIGGVALAGLVDSSLNLISRVESGRAFETTYQDAALEITMLGARLARWRKTYMQYPDPTATEEQGQMAEDWLQAIQKRLEDAVQLGVKYEKEGPPAKQAEVGSGGKAVLDKPRITDKVRGKLGLEKFRVPIESTVGFEVTLADRTKWALKDEAKMNTLVANISRLVTNIEKIFPSLELALVAATREEAAAIQPSAIDEPEEAILEVQKAARKVDRRLETSVRSLEAFEHASVRVGDRFQSGFSAGENMPEAQRITIDALQARGYSNVTVGHDYNVGSYGIWGNERLGGPRRPPGGGGQGGAGSQGGASSGSGPNAKR
ncbi:hypothetical protein LTR95_007536 [Oleoguttula sp. CCFEE 5521]